MCRSYFEHMFTSEHILMRFLTKTHWKMNTEESTEGSKVKFVFWLHQSWKTLQNQGEAQVSLEKFVLAKNHILTQESIQNKGLAIT